MALAAQLCPMDIPGPWFVCVSAYVTDIPQNRWGQHRQNFLSVFHDQVGLIVGGGNTKLQPLWSNFAVGDTSLLSHRPGDENPDFSPREGLVHVPREARYEVSEGRAAVDLQYGPEQCRLSAQPRSERHLALLLEATCGSGQPVAGHVVLLPRAGDKLRLASGPVWELGAAPRVAAGEAWIEHRGWRAHLPAGARVVWPALPHNPYRKGGEALPEEGRIVVVLPFSPAAARHEVIVEAL